MTDNRLMELPTERQEADDAAPDAFVLTVVAGPDTGVSQKVDPASPTRLLLGKSITCKLQLTDAEVSRRHASIRPEANVLVVSDLGSTNGTHVNGVSVREAMLRGGEAIRVGCTTITVTRGAPSFVTLSHDDSFGRMLGTSRAIRRLYPILHRLASVRDPVLLEGEIGVGKELYAEEIHAHSSRAGRPFVVLACHTISSSDIERRLFEPDGLLARAAGGSVYIDEIATLPARVQRQLATSVDGLDARLFFGTRRDLDQDVGDGTFSEALLVKLAPTRVELPPLRDRDGDVGRLAQAFWHALAAQARRDGAAGLEDELPADFLVRFHRYRWPGNVRELSAAVSARFNTGELGRWRAAGVSGYERDHLRAVVDREMPLVEARQLVVDEFERRYVEHMLSRHGSTRDAAQASGVGVRYFQVLRSRFEI